MKKLLLLPLLIVTFFCLAQDAKEIIGKPITIGNLVVAQNDFPKLMNWVDAKRACAALGKGWRLPTKEELNILYQNKDKIGGFAYDYYWSSTEYDHNYAWYQVFYNGSQFDVNKGYALYVRAVRAL